MSKSDDIEFLCHILGEVQFILKTTNNLTETDFFEDGIIKRAVVRSFEIIVQATKNLNMDFRYKYPEIPWKFMAGMRDILIHEYMGVDYKLVFKTAIEDIPELHFQIEQIIKENSTK
jgi:uncharacterized protein with HEPN domain